MKSSHRFPLRRQIVWGMRFFTFLTSLAVGAALFILSNQYVRANSLQAAEFNLRLVATSIETSLDSADALLNWASIDSTVRRYITQENAGGIQTIAAYEAVQEKCSSMQAENRQSIRKSVVAAVAVQKNAEAMRSHM
jgi:two-component system sensor histidine kinase YesM